MYVPKAGDIGISSSTGPIGNTIRWAQKRLGSPSFITHAFIVLESGFVLEGAPKGARFNRLENYPNAIFSQFDLTDDQRKAIWIEAVKMHGTQYSWLDHVALGATHFNIKPEPIRNRVENSGKMICSQLCAEAYRRAGVELFPDKRLSLDVIPADLHRLFCEMGWVDN